MINVVFWQAMEGGKKCELNKSGDNELFVSFHFKEVLDRIHLSSDMFNLYLHQNYLEFFSDVDDVVSTLLKRIPSFMFFPWASTRAVNNFSLLKGHNLYIILCQTKSQFLLGLKKPKFIQTVDHNECTALEVGSYCGKFNNYCKGLILSGICGW